MGVSLKWTLDFFGSNMQFSKQGLIWIVAHVENGEYDPKSAKLIWATTFSWQVVLLWLIVSTQVPSLHAVRVIAVIIQVVGSLLNGHWNPFIFSSVEVSSPSACLLQLYVPDEVISNESLRTPPPPPRTVGPGWDRFFNNIQLSWTLVVTRLFCILLEAQRN